MRALTQAEIVKAVAGSASKDEEQVRQFVTHAVNAIRDAAKASKTVEFADIGVLKPGSGGGERVSLDGLVGGVASASGVPEADCRELMGQFVSQLRSSMLRSRAVAFDGLATIGVAKEKAKIVKDPKKGHKLISPPKKSFTFQPAAAVSGAKFDLSDKLRGQIEASRASTILLVIPERDFFTKTLEYYFKRAGWETVTATSVDEAKKKLDAEGTFLVIVDSAVSKHQGLCRDLKCARETSSIPLIILFPKGTNLDRPPEIMVCGDEHVVQPFEMRKLLNIADSELVRSAEEEAIFEQQVLFQFPTEDVWIEASNELGHNLFEASGLREEDQVALSAAFREAIGNAAQHGNKYRRDKKIEILYLLDKEKITAMVKDTGNGFDHQRYVKRGKAGDALNAARERHKEGKLGGLGIMLMLKCVDRLEYNDKGNSVTLTKYLSPQQAAQSN